MSASLRLERPRAGVVRVVLSRPELRNAFDDASIAEVTATFAALSSDASVRVVVLAGDGKAFCAGADLSWMKRMVTWGEEENRRDAEALGRMFLAIDSCPKPVVGRVHGAALGGGAGLVAVCDVAVCAEGTLLGTTEVRLGIVPAVISPFVVRKVGESHARRWFLTGERFGADEALRAGLVHVVVPEAELDAEVDRVVDALLLGGPEALAVSKGLAKRMGRVPTGEALAEAAGVIAARRVSPEGQEGMDAFLGKRPPSWARETGQRSGS
ncbi:MAG: enoyl-CoA hydratase/isomerase family protein [Thermoanaerobaculia bacterium]|nr:enoyl-CoA hydratase/isomerase family protein [Thermoanaerobaculia bacterium]